MKIVPDVVGRAMSYFLATGNVNTKSGKIAACPFLFCRVVGPILSLPCYDSAISYKLSIADVHPLDYISRLS